MWTVDTDVLLLSHHSAWPIEYWQLWCHLEVCSAAPGSRLCMEVPLYAAQRGLPKIPLYLSPSVGASVINLDPG